MDIGGYKIRNQKEIHFISFAIVEWVDAFSRKEYRDILVDSLKFCRGSKRLLLHRWCIMSNHVNLLASSGNHDLSGILGDFKKFTSKKIVAAIINNEHESRKEWMIEMFRNTGKTNCRNTNYQFWRQDNRPFVFQKMNYINNNPVRAGIVEAGKKSIFIRGNEVYWIWCFCS